MSVRQPDHMSNGSQRTTFWKSVKLGPRRAIAFGSRRRIPAAVGFCPSPEAGVTTREEGIYVCMGRASRAPYTRNNKNSTSQADAVLPEMGEKRRNAIALGGRGGMLSLVVGRLGLCYNEV